MFSARAGSGTAQRATGAKTQDEIASQGAATLNVKRLVESLRTDAHGLILKDNQPDPVRDLLRAPRQYSAAILSMRLIAACPIPRRRPDKHGPVSPTDQAR